MTSLRFITREPFRVSDAGGAWEVVQMKQLDVNKLSRREGLFASPGNFYGAVKYQKL
jgi:hypothetical protein